MYNLIEHSDFFSKTSGSLWHYNRDQLYLNANGTIADFLAGNNNSASLKFKTEIATRIGNEVTTKIFKYFLENP